MRARALVVAATPWLAFGACSHDWDGLGPSGATSSTGGHGGAGGATSGGGTTPSGSAGGTSTTPNGGGGATGGGGSGAAGGQGTGGGNCDLQAFGVCCGAAPCDFGDRCCHAAGLACSMTDCPEHHVWCDNDIDCTGSHVCCAHWKGGTPGSYQDVRCVNAPCNVPGSTTMDGDYPVCDTSVGACPGGLTCTPEPEFGGSHGVCK